MAESFYLLKRKGKFKLEPVDSSRNQCFEVNHSLYNYVVIMAVIDKLDRKGFIIDHEVIDKTISKTLIVGSCEQMHNIMHKSLLNLPNSKNIMGLKTIIFPAGVDYLAHMEKIWINPNYSYEYPYLVSTLVL